MNTMKSLSLSYDAGQLKLLDQTQLPHKEEWIEIRNIEEMVSSIHNLRVRGAPAIALAAALYLGKRLKEGCDEEELTVAGHLLREARPTAVNLMRVIDHLLGQPFEPKRLIAEVERLFQQDIDMCQRMAEFGSSLLEKGEGILTHCNTGGLATAGVGTAIGVLYESHNQGKDIHVYIDETRPLLQGGRLTAWEVGRLGIPYTLICDSMAGFLMKQEKIQRVIVGADRIAMNGDFANKVGTYSLACLCAFHKIPFMVVAPHTTLDPNCTSGSEIPIEQRSDGEVKGYGSITWAPKDSRVYNPAFDVTPAKLVHHWVLDTGVYSQDQVARGELQRASVGSH